MNHFQRHRNIFYFINVIVAEHAGKQYENRADPLASRLEQMKPGFTQQGIV